MVEKEELSHSILKRIPRCRVEIKWIVDITYFMAFLLLSMLVPNASLNGIEIAIFIGIGVCFSIAKIRNFSRTYMIVISFLVVIVMFVPKMTGQLQNLPGEILDFIRYYIHYTTWLMLGNAIGSIIRSILNYWMCKRGEIS